MLPQITPLRPIRQKIVPIGREWAYEPKLDGFRGVLYVERGQTPYFLSKTSRRLKRFDELAAAIAAELRVLDAIFDGEVVVFGANGPDFKTLMRNQGEPSYAAFDLLWLNGRDLRPRRYTERKRALRRVATQSSLLTLVDTYDQPQLYEAAVKMDLEGIVCKRKRDPYTADTEWIKVKSPTYSQNEGRWELFQR